jgi:hypothetical protein
VDTYAVLTTDRFLHVLSPETGAQLRELALLHQIAHADAADAAATTTFTMAAVEEARQSVVASSLLSKLSQAGAPLLSQWLPACQVVLDPDVLPRPPTVHGGSDGGGGSTGLGEVDPANGSAANRTFAIEELPPIADEGSKSRWFSRLPGGSQSLVRSVLCADSEEVMIEWLEIIKRLADA